MKKETIDFTTKDIRTYSGNYIDVFAPNPSGIWIVDIAHGLANTCRFGGHTRAFYSVAQHCLLCSQLAPKGFALEALLHDAGEAYLPDMPRPIKKRLPAFAKIDQDLTRIIFHKWGLDYPMSEEVKRVDNYALEYEWENIVIKNTGKISTMRPYEAEMEFLYQFKSLSNEHT